MNYYGSPKNFDNSITMFKRMITIIDDYDRKNELLEEEVINLTKAVEELRNNPRGGITYGLGQTPTDMVINTTIREIYLRYIKTYGMPEDGIFLPSLLNELMNSTSNNILVNQSVVPPGALSGTVSPSSTMMSSPTLMSSPSVSASAGTPYSPVNSSEPVEFIDQSGNNV